MQRKTKIIIMSSFIIAIALLIIFLNQIQIKNYMSDYLRNRRIKNYLFDKSNDYKIAYRNIAMLSQKDGKTILSFVWSNKIQTKIFENNPCTLHKKKLLKIKDEGFDRFHQIVDEAISSDSQAVNISDKNEKEDKVLVYFFKCNI